MLNAVLNCQRLVSRSARTRHGSRNSTDVDVQWGTVEAVGFIEAAREGSQGVLLARSLLTDRSSLIFPAWVLIAGLIFAATLIRVSTIFFFNSEKRSMEVTLVLS